MGDTWDFSGWATKNNLKCADGKIILRDAFKVNDGKRVPLVWNHQHNKVSDVLGHAILENKDQGVYAYCYFNNSPAGENAKEIVKHGDVTNLSIWADNLNMVDSNVKHGVIREVSLVLAGANPGAFIESVLSHGEAIEEFDVEGLFYTDDPIILAHSTDNTSEDDQKKEDKNLTVKEVYETMNDDQKLATAIIASELSNELKKGDGNDNNEEEDKEMRHTVFDGDGNDNGEYLSHSQIKQIFDDAKRNGSLKEATKQATENGILKHSIDSTGMEVATGKQTYGFNDPEMLFPDYRIVGNRLQWLSRDMNWVQKVMASVHHTPFSRIKSVFADITEDEARARGYIKGKQKKDEVFTTLKRVTEPDTVYKKQRMDRGDIISITDFDIAAEIKGEMRMMLNEEIARAILIGDGRPSSSEDKIKEDKVRPIVSDVPLFNVIAKVSVPTGASASVIAKETIREIIRSRKKYKGSGSPTFWTTEDVITEMLLLEDNNGRTIYETETSLATKLRVKEIVPVEPMSGQTVTIGGKLYPLIGTIVNLADYNVGADKGGEIAMFDDFDINFNQYIYLIETMISGALIKPFSSITVVLNDPKDIPSDDDDDDESDKGGES